MIHTHYKLDGTMERTMTGYTGDNCFTAADVYDKKQPGLVEKERTLDSISEEGEQNYETA